VIAAVNVVFPWSTCPIVPTFTCGFVRSNLAFAMVALSVVVPWCSVALGDSYQLSAISHQLSAISYQLSAISYQLSVFPAPAPRPQLSPLMADN
jgi:hypothetical protein